MQESIDQSILEDQGKERAEERELMRKEREVDAIKLFLGLILGFGVFGSGIVLVISGGFGSLLLTVWGLLSLPIGVWITAMVILGGLGPSAWYRLVRYRVFRIWWNWIGSEESEEGEERERRKSDID